MKEKQRDYLYKKINGHGATFTEDSYGKLHCEWIYGKNKLQIMLINIHLWFIRFVEKLKGSDK